MIITEDNFIEELINKNEEALEYVVDEYSYILIHIINKNLFYLQDRKDECLNDCLLAIWNNIESYNPAKAKFTSWIGAIAKYKTIDYTRKYLKDREVSDIDDQIVISEYNSLDEILEKEFNKQVRELLSYLSEEDKKIFIEIYFNEKTAKEVSRKMNINESSIYNKLSRGRKKLKLIWGGKDYE